MAASFLLVALGALVSLPGHEVHAVCSRHSVENCSKPWIVWYNNTCSCGCSLTDVVSCSDKEVKRIKNCFCMTVDEGEAMVGTCPYTCDHLQNWYQNDTVLNDMLCNDTWKRTGRLCSQCIDGYGPLVYSYSMQCVPCSSDVVRNSILFFLTHFLLLTVFCLTIITLRISVAKPPMSTFVLVCQVMSAPQYMSLIFVPYKTSQVSSKLLHGSVRGTCWKLFTLFFGIWNLDILRSVFPHMCLSKQMSTLQAKYLEYVIALFPLATLLIVYFCIKLYNRGYRIISCLCRPMLSCLARLRQTVNVQSSLIDAFATFIILSVNKIGYTSFIILQPAHVFSPNGSYSLYTYIDPTVEYFGWSNIPYALTALVLTIIFILIPLLLLFFYPLRSFQNFLNKCQWQCSTLHIFADTFHGCYKNGTNGTRDYRWFAGLHLLLRFIIIFFFDMSNYFKVNAVLMVTSIAFYMGLLAMLRPYKKHIHLKLDMILLFGLLLWCTALQVYVMQLDTLVAYNFAMHLVVLIAAALIPLLFSIVFVLYWISDKINCCKVRKLREINSTLSTSLVRLLEESA